MAVVHAYCENEQQHEEYSDVWVCFGHGGCLVARANGSTAAHFPRWNAPNSFRNRSNIRALYKGYISSFSALYHSPLRLEVVQVAHLSPSPPGSSSIAS